MKRTMATTILIATVLFAAQAHAAGITVPDEFDADMLFSPLPSGFVHQIETVYNPSYGKGVVFAVAIRRGFEILRVDDNGVHTIATIGQFPDGAELLTMRFDRAGSFGKLLFVSVFHSNGDQPFNYQTDIVMINPDGTFETVASFGKKTNPMAMHFDTTRFNPQFPDGMYLLDGDNAAGAAMYHLRSDGTPTELTADIRPPGRTDLDPRGFEFGPTGLYGRFPTLADSDDDDRISAIYQWKGNLTVGAIAAPVSITTREFGDMAFSPGGAFSDRLYVTERRSKKVLIVSFRGQFADFASGFNDVQSITIDGDGEQMYVSDADGIYHIWEHVIIIPPTIVGMSAKVVTAGVGADDATGSRMVVGQSATGSTSNGAIILHAGWIPSLYGAALAPMFADFDGNRIIDLDDYQDLNACLDGPGADAGDACARGDSDRDRDVDLEDAAAFMRSMTESSP